jgi:hypothetical protein
MMLMNALLGRRRFRNRPCGNGLVRLVKSSRSSRPKKKLTTVTDSGEGGSFFLFFCLGKQKRTAYCRMAEAACLCNGDVNGEVTGAADAAADDAPAAKRKKPVTAAQQRTIDARNKICHERRDGEKNPKKGTVVGAAPLEAVGRTRPPAIISALSRSTRVDGRKHRDPTVILLSCSGQQSVAEAAGGTHKGFDTGTGGTFSRRILLGHTTGI